MGAPTSKQKSGLYAMKWPKTAVPQLAGAKRYAAANQPSARDSAQEVPLHRPPGPVARTGFVDASVDPRSTFSIDVDTAGYARIRSELRQRIEPHPDSVRLEEMINYFDYDYPAPTSGDPLAVSTEVGACPWAPDHALVRIGVQGRRVPPEQTPPRNLVFLVDVSGSMSSDDKLGLLRPSLALLSQQLDEDDRLAIVTYAGNAGTVLEPTPGDHRREILEAIGGLSPGGSTNGASGIEHAYALAEAGFVEGGVNRVVLATDGDFNVGLSSHDGLVELIEAKRRSGVALSVLGFGYESADHTMEQLADHGNGNYAHIDGLREAQKVLVEEVGGTLQTIAKDVKIQVEMNPDHVESFRLVGYDNRVLAHEDFEDDTKDAGEVGAGHSVTALYEVVLEEGAPRDGTLLDIGLRFKPPQGDHSEERSFPVPATVAALDDTSDDFRFAAAVAQFGEQLRGAQTAAQITWGDTFALAADALGDDPMCRRHGFLELVQRRAGMHEATSLKAPVCDDEGLEVPELPQVGGDEDHAGHHHRGHHHHPPRRGPDDAGTDWEQLVLEAIRLLPPLLALPLFVIAFPRPRRRRAQGDRGGE